MTYVARTASNGFWYIAPPHSRHIQPGLSGESATILPWMEGLLLCCRRAAEHYSRRPHDTWTSCQSVLAINARASASWRGSQRWRSRVRCSRRRACVWLPREEEEEEESAPRLIGILNECVLFPSDACAHPRAAISDDAKHVLRPCTEACRRTVCVNKSALRQVDEKRKKNASMTKGETARKKV